ncbi:MAG TPA: hypothetical protein VFN94_03660 [Nitrospiria bacterium]|nr:hypothetical protein [Nitrospiria bacterium]
MNRTGPLHADRGIGCRLFAIAWLALTVTSAVSCRSGDDSPDAKIRATIARAETFAEAKDLGGLRDLLSDAYRDDAGQDKRAILGLLFLQVRRHESIHLLTRIDRIDVRPPQAESTVFVAMAGSPIAGADDLPSLRADLYRFDLTLVEERGTWRVAKSSWRPAALTDF